jgi:hypothetical protein
VSPVILYFARPSEGLRGWAMSPLIASNTTLNCASYFFSSATRFFESSALLCKTCRSRTKARMISTFTWIARGLFKTPDSMATPCSVNA